MNDDTRSKVAGWISALVVLALVVWAVVTATPANADDGVKHLSAGWSSAEILTYGTTPADDNDEANWTIVNHGGTITAAWFRYNSRSASWVQVWPPVSTESDAVVTLSNGVDYHDVIGAGAHKLVLTEVVACDAEVLWR